MSANRNLDIAKVKKPSDATIPEKNAGPHKIIRHPAPRRLGYLRLLAQSWQAVFDSSVFQIALIRNLAGIRSLFFALIPVFYFQFKFLMVLVPAQILYRLRLNLAPENTSVAIGLLTAVFAMILVSFLADTLVTPAILRYRFQKLNNRKVKMTRSILESMSLSFASLGQKLVKTGLSIILAGLVLLLCYVVLILGYGSLPNQLAYLSVLFLIGLVLISIYFSFKYWLTATFAISDGEGRSRIGIALDRAFMHPLSSIGYGFNWLISLALPVAFSFFVAWLEIRLLNDYSASGLQLATLAVGTTAIYICWSVWSAWQGGYWASIVAHNAPKERLEFSAIRSLRVWQFVGLLVIVVGVLVLFVFLAYMFSSGLINILNSASKSLPTEIKFYIPKPH